MSQPPEDPVSPELAVVDSALRGRLTAEPGGSTETRGSHRSGRSRAALALVLLVAVVVAGVAATVLIRRAQTSGPTAAPVARNFDWAPVAGATAYDVEILRDRAVVYSTRTAVPHVRVPARWTRGAQTLSLSPGTYRWFVWPVRGSARRGPAVIATTFEIGPH